MAKSVAKNALYSGLRTVCNMVFPLITYPYAARVLLAENLGKVDFGSSIISYFLLIAGLGIITYATREGAARREDREELNRFSSEVFTINIVSTAFAYLLLGCLIALWPRLQGYALLIAIQSLAIVGTTLGVEWVYAVHEDYGYITARSIVVQVVSTILMFLLVKKPEDYIIYAGITVFANVGANLFNFIHSRRYVHIGLVWHFDYMKHLVPMLILFGNAIAITIYVNIDITLINIFKSDYQVGIYSLAVKVYTIIKSLLNSITGVSLPRLSLYKASGQTEEYEHLQELISHALVVIVLPVMALFFLMADYVVMIIGGEGFALSVRPLRILCTALIPAVFACYVTSAIILPNRGEMLNLKATAVGAIVNLVANLLVIPMYGIVGAAFTTVFAEFVVLFCSVYLGRDFCDWRHMLLYLRKPTVTAVLSVCAMVLTNAVLRHVVKLDIIGFFEVGFALVGSAVLMMALLRDELFLGFARRLVKRR